MKLIVKSVLICLMLLFGYNLYAVYLVSPTLRTGDSQWADNVIRAQNFIYGERDTRVVIAGSSLSWRLDATLLPEDLENLAFGGMSAQDGLRLLVRSGMAPELVLVEVNYLPRPERPGFSDGLFMPGMYSARQHIAALREQKRPLGVIGTFLGRIIRGMGDMFKRADMQRPIASAHATGAGAVGGGQLFDKFLVKQLEGHAHPVPPKSLASTRKNVAPLLDALAGRGTRVVFFQLPGHPDICDSPRIQSTLELVHTSFSGYPYIELGNCHSVATTDGIHLDPDSARRITRELLEQLPELLRG
ncbi:MAG: hypothetical protein ACE5FN_11565 [Leptospirillia bacterium]